MDGEGYPVQFFSSFQFRLWLEEEMTDLTKRQVILALVLALATLACGTGEVGNASTSDESNAAEPQAVETNGPARTETTESSPADEFLSQGQTAFAAYDYSTAIDAYQSALNLDDSPALAYYGLGEVYAAMDFRLDAAKSFNQYLEAVPNEEDRAEVENWIDRLKNFVDVQPGNHTFWGEEIEPGGTMSVSFVIPTSDYFGPGPDTALITVKPNESMDVRLQIWDTSREDQVLVSESDEFGTGGIEQVSFILNEDLDYVAFYRIDIVVMSGDGYYEASIDSSPAVAIAPGPYWETVGILGDNQVLGYVIGGIDKSIGLAAVPWPDENINLFIQPVSLGGDDSVPKLDDAGWGEPEYGRFGFGDQMNVYLLIIGDTEGNSGIMTFRLED